LKTLTPWSKGFFYLTMDYVRVVLLHLPAIKNQLHSHND